MRLVEVCLVASRRKDFGRLQTLRPKRLRSLGLNPGR